jgi:hypothetical protein
MGYVVPQGRLGALLVRSSKKPHPPLRAYLHADFWRKELKV